MAAVVSCAAQVPVPQGAVSKCTTATYGSECSVSCASGYTGTTVSYNCSASGVWRPVTLAIACAGTYSSLCVWSLERG